MFITHMNARQYVLLVVLTLVASSVSAEWRSFKWAEVQVGETFNRRAGILLPVKLDGITCDMQLDTGIGLSVLYRNSLPARYSELLRSDSLLIERFSLGPETSAKRFQLKFKRRDKPQRKCVTIGSDGIVGTLGNDLLLTGAISLDLLNGRFRLINRSLSAAETAGSRSIDIEVFTAPGFGSFPVVTLSFENGDSRRMLFDTGSASLDLVVYLRRDWLSLVGFERLEGLVPILMPRFGRLVPCYRAPINQAIQLGDVRLGTDTTAMYCDDPRDSPQEGNQVFGVLGLAPFTKSTVSLDYLARKLFIKAAQTYK